MQVRIMRNLNMGNGMQAWAHVLAETLSGRLSKPTNTYYFYFNS